MTYPIWFLQRYLSHNSSPTFELNNRLHFVVAQFSLLHAYAESFANFLNNHLWLFLFSFVYLYNNSKTNFYAAVSVKTKRKQNKRYARNLSPNSAISVKIGKRH